MAASVKERSPGSRRAIGGRLRALRIDADMSLGDLATAVDAPIEHIAAIESGDVNLDAEDLLRLSAAISDAAQPRGAASQRASGQATIGDAVLLELDIAALHKLRRVKDPAVKRELIRLIGALVDAAESRADGGPAWGALAGRMP